MFLVCKENFVDLNPVFSISFVLKQARVDMPFQKLIYRNFLGFLFDFFQVALISIPVMRPGPLMWLLKKRGGGGEGVGGARSGWAD